MKKVLIMFLALLQLLMISAYASGAQITVSQQEDLKNLGIMIGDESGDLRLGDTITRAEAVKMICTAGNIKIKTSGSEEPSFVDVPREYWANKYINAAKEKNIVCGDNNGLFNPESSITNEEIAKMIVCLLGYGDMAKHSGGYPAGYTAVAERIGVTANLNLKGNLPAVRNDVAIMISNALDIPLMAEKSSEENGTTAKTYIILDGKNGIPFSSIRGARGKKHDTSRDNINRLVQSFASKYPYKEGDTEKTFELYPGVLYSSGIETAQNGTVFEYPAIFDDNMAIDEANRIILMTSGKLKIDSETYETDYAIFNGKKLVPYDMFEVIGCKVLYYEDEYVATIEKDDTVLEIMPNIIGMRKNRESGYWVPLSVCARFINDTLYVPAEAVLNEYGYRLASDSEGGVKIIKR